MCDKCQACMYSVQERVRQAQFGHSRSHEELRDLETAISGHRDPWREPHQLKTIGEEVAGNDLLQGGGVLQELTRQATFGYARNSKGEQVRLNDAQARDLLRREIEAAAIEKAGIAQAAAPCSSCCKSNSCNWTTAKR